MPPPWTAPTAAEIMTVPDGPTTGDEGAMLGGYLRWQRSQLLDACAGLTGEQLVVRSVPPSSLSLLGLVRHLAKVERIWWRLRLDGEDVVPVFDPALGKDHDFDALDPARAEADHAFLLAEWATCDATAARHDLDEEFDSRQGPWTVRMLHLHLIGEYAQHNGHADLLRERVLAEGRRAG